MADEPRIRDPKMVERFMSKIAFIPYHECWEWTAGVRGKGYGVFHVRSRESVQAHRFSYELFVGPIPAGLQIDHLCRNKPCVNPAHLEAVTGRVNFRRGIGPIARAANSATCSKGHPWNDANTRWWHGIRRCVACQHATDEARSARGHHVNRLESECEALREQLEAVTRELTTAKMAVGVLTKTGLNLAGERDSLRAELAAAQSQFKALQEHMGKSGPWPKQVEVDGAYWRPQVETLRAQLEQARSTIHKLVGPISTPDGIVGGWDFIAERDRLAARVAKLEAAGAALAAQLRAVSVLQCDEVLAWDAAVKPEQQP